MEKELINIFDNLFSKANDDGVIELDSGHTGEEVSIVGLTHGDEVVGLYVFDYLINKFDIQKKLKRGKLNLIFGNLKASYEKLKNGKQMSRCFDENFNRVWKKDLEEYYSYEKYRRDQIVSYLENSNVLVDVHSTSEPSPTMILPVKENKVHLSIADRLYGDYLFTNIYEFVDGGTIAEYHSSIDDKNISFTIESGQHTDKTNFNYAINNVLVILAATGLIKNSDLHFPITQQYTKKLEIYYCYYSCREGESIEYIYSKNPQSFHKIGKGTHIADTDSGNIYADKDCYIIMPMVKAPLKGEEMFYLAYEK